MPSKPITFFALTLWLVSLGAQDAPLVRSSSRLVLLDVVVTNKTGHPVRSLTKDDFTIFENGIPQKIASFEGAHIDPNGARPPNSRNLILLDELNVAYENLAYARDRILLFLDRYSVDKQPTALMAIGPRGLSMLEDFTQDRRRLKDKLDHLPAVDANAKGGAGVDNYKVQEHGEMALHALSEIAQAAVGSPDSLNLIWITSGFSGTLKTTGADTTVQTAFRSLSNLLIHSRMRLYTIDPSGAMPLTEMAAAAKITRGSIHDGHDSAAEKLLGSTGSVQMSERELMKTMTQTMGGVSYYGRNDVDIAIEEAIIDGSSAYRISYAPTNSDFDGKYRKIEVQTAIPDTSARTRDGYYAVADEAVSDPAIRDARLDAALASPLSYSGLAVDCPASFDSAHDRLTGKLIVRPQQMTGGSDQKEQIFRIASFSKDHKQLDIWLFKANWKDPWTNREVSASFDKTVSPKATLVRFLVSDPAAERMGTCEYKLHELGTVLK